MNTKRFEVGIFNSMGLEWSVIAYSYGPDHSKTKPLEIQQSGGVFFKQNVIGKQGAVGKRNRGLGIPASTVYSL